MEAIATTPVPPSSVVTVNHASEVFATTNEPPNAGSSQDDESDVTSAVGGLLPGGPSPSTPSSGVMGGATNPHLANLSKHQKTEIFQQILRHKHSWLKEQQQQLFNTYGSLDGTNHNNGTSQDYYMGLALKQWSVYLGNVLLNFIHKECKNNTQQQSCQAKCSSGSPCQRNEDHSSSSLSSVIAANGPSNQTNSNNCHQNNSHLHHHPDLEQNHANSGLTNQTSFQLNSLQNSDVNTTIASSEVSASVMTSDDNVQVGQGYCPCCRYQHQAGNHPNAFFPHQHFVMSPNSHQQTYYNSYAHLLQHRRYHVRNNAISFKTTLGSYITKE